LKHRLTIGLQLVVLLKPLFSGAVVVVVGCLMQVLQVLLVVAVMMAYQPAAAAAAAAANISSNQRQKQVAMPYGSAAFLHCLLFEGHPASTPVR
jgi:uncharacterized membrane protein